MTRGMEPFMVIGAMAGGSRTAKRAPPFGSTITDLICPESSYPTSESALLVGPMRPIGRPF